MKLLLPSLFLILILSWISSCQSNPFQQGEILYNNFCASCHMEDGSGLQGLIPPLAQADYVRNNPNELACIIRYGQTGEVVVNGQKYNQPMAGISALSEFEIANVINYINQAWGNDYGYVPLNKIREELEKCE